MQKRIYGRSPSLVAKHAEEMSAYYVERTNSLIYRTLLDRPLNENAIRGII